MQNNAGAPQAQGLMYYYVAVPGQGAQPGYAQGGEGMNQGMQFDAQQGFPAGQQFYTGDQDPSNVGGVNVAQMGHQQMAMMPTGQGNMMPGQMMVLMPPGGQMQMGQMQPQMPNQQEQQGTQDTGQANGGWQGMPQQAAHEPQPQTPSVSSTRSSASRAFKIVNPNTKEEVKLKSGQGGEGTPSNAGSGGGTGSGGPPRDMQGTGPGADGSAAPQVQNPQQAQGQPGHLAQGGPMQQPVPAWQQAPFGAPAGPAQSTMGQNVGMQQGNSNMQQQGNMQKPPMQPQGMMQMPQQGKMGPTGNQQPQQPPQPQAPAAQPAPASSAAPAAGSKKKMMNKKIEKPKAEAEAAAASPAASTPVPPEPQQRGTEQSQPASGASQQAPQPPQPSSSEQAAAPKKGPGLSPLPPAPALEKNMSQRQADIANLRAGTTSSFASQLNSGQGSSQFASSIKALNLEPMRATNSTPFRPKARPHTDNWSTLPQVPSQFPGNQQNSSQNQGSNQDQNSAQKQQTQPSQSQAHQSSQPQQAPQQNQTGQQAPQSQPQPQQAQQSQQMQQAQQPQQLQPQQPPQQMQQPTMQQSHMPMQPMQPQIQQSMQPTMQPAPMQQQPMPSMQPQPAPNQTAASAAPPAKSKGVKLKNAALARPTKPKTDEELAAQAAAAENAGAAQNNNLAAEAGAQAEPARASDPQEQRNNTSPAEVAKETIASLPTPSRRIDLSPADGIFDRTLLLRIWRSNSKDAHPTVASLCTSLRPGEKGTPMGGDRKGRGGARGNQQEIASDRAAVFGTDLNKSKNKKADTSFKPTDNGYRVTEAKARDEKLEREVRSLLNKICPENLKAIVERLANIELYNAGELEFVIKIIFQKALAEPHYCETYADMVYALRTRYQEFKPENEGEKPVTFTRVLLNTCQNEFENLPTSFEPTEEEKQQQSKEDLQLEMKKRKDKTLANMKFIGNLFLRQLLAVKVIGQVVHDLIGLKDGEGSTPEEHMIECVCELLEAIGFTLDGTSHGKMLMQSFVHRLTELKTKRDGQRKDVYSKRIQFGIQDLLEMRLNNWQKRLYREQASTKDQIRKDAQKATKSKTDDMFATATAGVRPACMDDLKNIKPSKGNRTEVQQKLEWSAAHVKKCFQYFAEDKSGHELQVSWQKANPTAKQSKEGVELLADVGANDPQKEDVVAETLVELLHRQAITWNTLSEGMQSYIDGLEDMKIDVPQCDLFLHSLLSRLLITADRNFPFNPVLLKQIERSHENTGSDFAGSLIIGALKKVRRNGGQEAYRRALDAPHLMESLQKIWACSRQEVTRYLQSEIH